MTPKNPLRYAAILTFAILLVSACKKKTQEEPTPTSTTVNRKVKVIRDSSVNIVIGDDLSTTTVYTFDYQTDSTLKHIGYVRTSYTTPVQIIHSGILFIYEPGKVIKIDTFNSSVDTMKIDSLGRLRNAYGGIYDYYFSWPDRLWHFYNSNWWTYNWNADDVNYSTYDPIDTFRYDYYTDKTIRMGDGTQLDELMKYGRTVTKNKHLVKSWHNQRDFVSKMLYAYTYDSYDRVVQMTSVNVYGLPPDTSSMIHFYSFEY